MAKALMLLLAGVAIGILIAPKKGEDTRRKITNRLEDIGDEAEGLVKDASSKIKSKLQSAKGNMKDLADEKL